MDQYYETQRYLLRRPATLFSIIRFSPDCLLTALTAFSVASSIYMTLIPVDLRSAGATGSVVYAIPLFDVMIDAALPACDFVTRLLKAMLIRKKA